MRIAELKKHLCILIVMGLLFSGLCFEVVRADAAFPHEISLNLAEHGRVFRDICTEDLFGTAGGDTVGEHIPEAANHQTAYWLPVRQILTDYCVPQREASAEPLLYPAGEKNAVIGYIHRQDGKKD